MKNVCFFNSIEFWGGGEKLHLEYALEFKKKNYKVWLVSHKNSPLSKKGSQLGLNIFHISAGNLSFLNPLKLIRLSNFYKKNNIDTIIFSTSQDAKLGSFSGKIAGVKNIVYLRGLAAVIKNSFVNRVMFKYMLTHIVVNSDATKNKVLQNLSQHVDNVKVGRIYHGIEIGEIDKTTDKILATIKDKGKGVILGNAGRLTLQKGQQHLIKVANQLKKNNIEFTIFIAGTGELLHGLEEEIKKYNLQNEVILLGFVEDMEKFMNSIDIFLLTSEWEGFGYVIVEALVKTKPVIAFNISSNPEIIKNNETGFLIDFPDTSMFATKTQELILDKEKRSLFGINGRKDVLARFDIKDRITEFEKFIIKKKTDSLLQKNIFGPFRS